MVRVLASSAIGRGFDYGRVKPATTNTKLVFVAFPLITHR